MTEDHRHNPIAPGAGLHPRIGRSRRRHRAGRKPSIGVNMAPMMDLTFLLLIFFLVTTSFERAEGILESAMPQAGDAAGVPLPITPIVIRLSAAAGDDPAYDLTVDRFSDAPRHIEALSAFLQDVLTQPGFDAETPVIIVGGDDVPWDHVVSCWNAALSAGCRQIAFAEP